MTEDKKVKEISVETWEYFDRDGFMTSRSRTERTEYYTPTGSSQIICRSCDEH